MFCLLLHSVVTSELLSCRVHPKKLAGLRVCKKSSRNSVCHLFVSIPYSLSGSDDFMPRSLGPSSQISSNDFLWMCINIISVLIVVVKSRAVEIWKKIMRFCFLVISSTLIPTDALGVNQLGLNSGKPRWLIILMQLFLISLYPNPSFWMSILAILLSVHWVCKFCCFSRALEISDR